MHIGTRTIPQVRSKLQKYFQKLEKEQKIRMLKSSANPPTSPPQSEGYSTPGGEDEDEGMEDSSEGSGQSGGILGEIARYKQQGNGQKE
jgi:hypothetical protein